jgi:hypothetical protein
MEDRWILAGWMLPDHRKPRSWEAPPLITHREANAYYRVLRSFRPPPMPAVAPCRRPPAAPLDDRRRSDSDRGGAWTPGVGAVMGGYGKAGAGVFTGITSTLRLGSELSKAGSFGPFGWGHWGASLSPRRGMPWSPISCDPSSRIRRWVEERKRTSFIPAGGAARFEVDAHGKQSGRGGKKKFRGSPQRARFPDSMARFLWLKGTTIYERIFVKRG